MMMIDDPYQGGRDDGDGDGDGDGEDQTHQKNVRMSRTVNSFKNESRQ